MNCCAAALKPIPASRKLTSFRYFFSDNAWHLDVCGEITQVREVHCTVPTRTVADAIMGEASDIKIRNGVVLIS